MSGPSDKAIAAAKRATREAQKGSGWLNSQHVPSALAAAHNPALGLDRSVCLRDAVRLLQRAGHEEAAGYLAVDQGVLEHELGPAPIATERKP